MRIFEVSDVAFKDESRERKSRNERHFAAAWCGKSSGFEVVHGLLDRVMAMLKSAYVTGEEGLRGEDKGKAAYWITEVDGEWTISDTGVWAEAEKMGRQIRLSSPATPRRFMCASAARSPSSVSLASCTRLCWRSLS